MSVRALRRGGHSEIPWQAIQDGAYPNLALPFADKLTYAVNGAHPWRQIAPRNAQEATTVTGLLRGNSKGGFGSYTSGTAGEGLQYGNARQGLFTGNTFAILAIINEAASGSVQNWIAGEYGYPGASKSSAVLITNSNQGAIASGYISLTGYDSSFQYRFSAAGVVDGKTHVVMMARTGAGTGWCAVDGRMVAVTFGAETSNATTDSNMRTVFAGIPPIGSSVYGCRAPVLWVQGWNGVAIPEWFGVLVTGSPGLLVESRRIWVPVSAVGGAQSIIVNQATETDLAQALVAAQRLAVSQTVETDLAQALAVAQARSVGQAAEADLAQALSIAQRRVLGQAQETDAAQGLTAAHRVAIGQASETSIAQALAALHRLIVEQAAETDQAQSVVYVAPGVIAQAAEADLAQPVAIAQRRAIGQSVEADAAQPVGIQTGLAVGVGLTLEIDTAFALAGLRLGLGSAAEIDVALAVVALDSGNLFETYPLAGDAQSFPLMGKSQVYPLGI